MLTFRASEVAALLGEHPYQNAGDAVTRQIRDARPVDFCAAVAEALDTDPFAGCLSNDDTLRRVAARPGLAKGPRAEQARASKRRCQVGIDGEAGALEWYAQQTGVPLTERNTANLCHEEGSWCVRGRVDGLSGHDTVVEVKHRVSDKTFYGDLPAYDRCQVNTYMALRGLDKAVVVEVLRGAEGEECKYSLRRLAFDRAHWDARARA